MALEHITFLHWWSRLSKVATAYALELGRAFALAMGGNQPSPETIASLRASLHRQLELLDHAERMDTGPAHAFEPPAGSRD